MRLLQLNYNAGRIPFMHSLNDIWTASIYFHATCLPLPPWTAMIKDDHLQKERPTTMIPSFSNATPLLLLQNLWRTTTMIPGNNQDTISLSLFLSLFVATGLPLCQLAIKWFIVGWACKICKKIACFATFVSGTADMAHFATCLQWQKKTMVTFTWVTVHNPQESDNATIQLHEESFIKVIEKFIIVLTKVIILTEIPRLLPMTANGLLL